MQDKILRSFCDIIFNFNIILVDTLLDWGIIEKVVFILKDNANNIGDNDKITRECISE